MKSLIFVAAFLAVLLFVPTVMSARHVGRPHSHHGHHHQTRPMMVKPNLYRERRQMKPGRTDTVEIAGSSLPDCSHACGSCSPCRLVIVSFVCASLEEAETCPMAYKCMCKNKSYPVP